MSNEKKLELELDVMIDTETLAIDPKAAIVQIGLAYRLPGNAYVHTKEICIKPSGYEGARNFIIDASTVKWHSQDLARAANIERCELEGSSVEVAAFILADILASLSNEGQHKLILWSCGTDFDFPILANLYKSQGQIQPWRYGNIRDYRTMRELFKTEVPMNSKGDHTAVADAVAQYEHLKEIRKYINRTEGVW